MNKSQLLNETQVAEPKAITAEEFDAKFEAGEDISEYLDWSKAEVVMPGELSTGQKLSIQAQLVEAQAQIVQALIALDSVQPDADHSFLSIPFPAWAINEIGKEATRVGIAQEAVILSWIMQRLEQQRVAS